MQGLGVSPGIAIGKVLLKKQNDFVIEKTDVSNPEDEILRLQSAQNTAREQVQNLHNQVEATMGAEEAKIFEAHIDIINDKTLFKEVEKRIFSEKANAEWALREASEIFISRFEGMKNIYMSERAADIKDITNRILEILLGIESADFSKLEEETILVAEELLPSDTAKIDIAKVKGFVTEMGGKTSHSAIMARTLEIPAVASAEGIMGEIKNGDVIILDGGSGEILINPSENIISQYKLRKKEIDIQKSSLNVFKGVKSISKDGVKVKIMANIGTPKDISAVLENDAEGVGLFRTEFLYMDRSSLPSEEEQFVAYKAVSKKMKNKPVIIRTLDVGGDKDIPYLGLPKEENPFLGYRAIRFCLDRRDVFHTQLRAILKASAYGKIKVMLPMISDLSELRQAKKLLEEAKASLKKENIVCDENIQIGIMIEIPSAAILSDLFADEVDFFSIGTNDLIQYMTAVDRGNSKVAHLYTSFHPAVLRIIKLVIDNAHKKGKWVGMCGEAAADPKLIPVFLAMGLDEFSMSPSFVLRARGIINNTSKKDIDVALGKILNLPTSEEIEKYIDENIIHVF